MGFLNDVSYTVLLFVLPNGKSPVQEFLDGQSKKMIAKIISRIDLLESNGPELREPFSKLLDDGIYELRCQAEGNQARILYFFTKDRHIILTNGFLKKTQKTPVAEIVKAMRYRSEYLTEIKKEKP